jgi:hypothetical protein
VRTVSIRTSTTSSTIVIPRCEGMMFFLGKPGCTGR